MVCENRQNLSKFVWVLQSTGFDINTAKDRVLVCVNSFTAMASCFSHLSRASSKARSNDSPRHSSNGTDSGRYSRDSGYGEGSLTSEIRHRLSKTFHELQPTVMTASDMNFVNMSFLHRNDHPGSAPARFVRRLSSIQNVDHQVHPPQPTGNQLTSNGLAQAYSVSRRYLEDAIIAEADRDRHAPADLQSEEARLRQRLARLRLDMLIMQGDGNCQFRSVSFGLYGTEDRHTEVRGRAIQYMRRNPSAFAVFLGEDYQQYLDNMARPGTWGDELTLVCGRFCYPSHWCFFCVCVSQQSQLLEQRALCEDYQLVINVIASTQAHWCVCCSSFPSLLLLVSNF